MVAEHFPVVIQQAVKRRRLPARALGHAAGGFPRRGGQGHAELSRFEAVEQHFERRGLPCSRPTGDNAHLRGAAQFDCRRLFVREVGGI